MPEPPPRRVVVGVTGASGTLYAADLLGALRAAPVEVHLVVSAGAKRVLPSEVEADLGELERLADVVHKDTDLGAPIASGSFRADAMAVVPCSANTLAKVATGIADTLVTRAAHVFLKERRPLLLLVREAPYSRPLLENLLRAFDAGATVFPASPGFYHRPTDLEELVGGITARLLDHLGVAHEHAPRWKDGDG